MRLQVWRHEVLHRCDPPSSGDAPSTFPKRWRPRLPLCAYVPPHVPRARWFGLLPCRTLSEKRYM